MASFAIALKSSILDSQTRRPANNYRMRDREDDSRSTDTKRRVRNRRALRNHKLTMKEGL